MGFLAKMSKMMAAWMLPPKLPQLAPQGQSKSQTDVIRTGQACTRDGRGSALPHQERSRGGGSSPTPSSGGTRTDACPGT